MELKPQKGQKFRDFPDIFNSSCKRVLSGEIELQKRQKTMPSIDVHPNDLKSLLKEIARREIKIRIKDQAGEWSSLYYSINDVKDLNNRNFSNFFLILKAAQNESAIIDIRSLKAFQVEEPIPYLENTGNEFSITPEWPTIL